MCIMQLMGTKQFRRSADIIVGIDPENFCHACHGAGCAECDFSGEEEETEPFCDGEEPTRWDLVTWGVDQ